MERSWLGERLWRLAEAERSESRPRRSVALPRRSAVGHLERFPPERVSGRCQIGQETSAGAFSGDGLAPTAGVCDKGVFWKSPLRPRTMLSLRRPAFSAARPDQVNERHNPSRLLANLFA